MMKKLLLTTMTTLTILFFQGQSTPCDSLTITGSHYQLSITANNLNTFVYYWETTGSDGTILEQDSSMGITHSIYNFNMTTGQAYDTLSTCITTTGGFCCAIIVWDGTNWINSLGSNPPAPANCNANFYSWQNFDSINNVFTTDIYCVENSSGGSGPFSYNWVFGDGNTSNIQYPTHVYNQVGDYNLCLTYTDANGCSSNFCDTISIVFKSIQYTLNVIDESQINTLDVKNSDIVNYSKVYPNPVNETSYLEYNSSKDSYINISYMDFTGKIIKNQKVRVSSGLNNVKILTQELNSGIYFLKVNDGKHVESITFVK